MTMSIFFMFSHVCWSFVFHLTQNACSCTFFFSEWVVCFVVVEFPGVCSFQMFHPILSVSSSLCWMFPLLWRSFEVWCNPFISFCSYCLCYCVFQKYLPILMFCRVFPILSSSKLMVSGHKFRSLIPMSWFSCKVCI